MRINKKNKKWKIKRSIRENNQLDIKHKLMTQSLQSQTTPFHYPHYYSEELRGRILISMILI